MPAEREAIDAAAAIDERPVSVWAREILLKAARRRILSNTAHSIAISRLGCPSRLGPGRSLAATINILHSIDE